MQAKWSRRGISTQSRGGVCVREVRLKAGHRMVDQRDLGEGARSGMSLNTVSYVSPLDGFPEHIHHVFPFTVSSLKAFGPLNEYPLKERRRNSLEH